MTAIELETLSVADCWENVKHDVHYIPPSLCVERFPRGKVNYTDRIADPSGATFSMVNWPIASLAVDSHKLLVPVHGTKELGRMTTYPLESSTAASPQSV